MNEVVRGYKVFNPDWTCKGKQYSCPGKFEEDSKLLQYGKGMHFCKRAIDCFNYYEFNPKNHVAEVIAFGNILGCNDNYCTNKLKIVREISWHELLTIVNIEECNTGLGNVGNHNSDDYNSGDYNSGYYNTGDRNSGNYNSGSYNAGDCNTGEHNSGDHNTSDFNTGDYNSG